MPNESTNLKLKLYDPDVDSNVLVYDFLKDIAGYTSSNFVKIDTSINTLHDSIIGTDGNVVFYNKQEVLLAVHPVGSIFLSTDGTEPAELYGGTWEQIKDVFLLGASDTYAAGSTGGEASHKLESNEMPSHTHIVTAYYNYDWNVKVGFGLGEIYVSSNHIDITGSQTLGTDIDRGYLGTRVSGGDEPHNNMPPYYSVYIWRRVA
jgi:hypothetical protein